MHQRDPSLKSQLRSSVLLGWCRYADLLENRFSYPKPWKPVEARKGADSPWATVACGVAGWRRDLSLLESPRHNDLRRAHS
jgi:hypothetical protein